MIRILLADDHPIMREGLRAVLETQPDFEIVGTLEQAANGEEALRLALELKPDILLLDLEMPVMDGVETIRRLRRQSTGTQKNGETSGPHVIVFTAFDNDERIIAALEAGANGYLLKGAPREEMFHAIRVTMQGGSLLQPVIASKLLRHMGQRQEIRLAHDPHPTYEALTERELEVLRLLAQGMPNKEIAAHLVISERTAKFHISSIMGKLGATNRTEAVALAAQKGLITLHA
ncbi:MAG TPA: response regulator transcription factor [Ktedonobacteraceae bacterium]|nr:response regulator transcription factor [Ktedonobacteraceae bacterium]